MKRFVTLIAAILACGMLLTACSGSASVDEPEEVPEETMITTTQPAAKPYIEDLNVENGDRQIYGKIYYPGGTEKCPAVIMSHGYNGRYTDFAKECKYFSDNGFVACTFDFCGGSARSKSSGKSTDMTIFTEKEDLLAVIDYISSLEQVDKSRVFLLGGSQGGLVSAMAAEERTEQVRGMVLYFPAFNIPDDWRNNFRNVNDIPEVVDFWGLQLGRNFFVSMRDYDVYENIGNFPNEVLIIHGDQDNIAPLSASRKASQKYDFAEILVMYGEGHGFSPDGADTAKEEALRFMESLS